MKATARKILVVLVITALSLAAGTAIVALFSGSVGNTQQKILITTGFLGLYSLTGLAAASLSSDDNVHPLSWAGIIASGIAFLLAVPGVWDWVEEKNYYWKAIFISLLVAVAIAHSALLMHLHAHSSVVKIIRIVTLSFITMAHLMLIWFIIDDFNPYHLYMRIVGSIAILAVLGTLVLPIISRIKKPLE